MDSAPPEWWLAAFLGLTGFLTMGFLMGKAARYRRKYCPRCRKKKQYLDCVVNEEVWICTRCGHKSITKRR